MRPELMPGTRKRAHERRLTIVQGDTGQSRRVADFLLDGGIRARAAAMTSRPHDDIVEDVIMVFRLASRVHWYPDTPGYGPQFEALVHAWRPELAS
jgi:hypothetical protein